VVWLAVENRKDAEKPGPKKGSRTAKAGAKKAAATRKRAPRKSTARKPPASDE
jgi:hypothetical protein